MKDKQIEKLIKAETARQKKAVNLIASENFVSKDVLEALGSVLTNKYAEGYSELRYYGGNEVVDKIERLTQDRALKTFNLKKEQWAVNVQALSGTPANLAILTALAPIGSKIMGLNLNSGGHLSHGHKASLSGKLWQVVSFDVDPKTHLLDYDDILKLAVAEKPKVIIGGFTAYPRVVDWKKLAAIAKACGAYFLVDMSHVAGLIAGEVYPSPFPFADVVMTTTHKTLRGPRSALIFSRIDERELPKKVDKAVFPGLQGGPHLNQIAGVAVALAGAARPAFKKYAKQTIKNAEVLASELTKAGFKVIAGGTDSHLLLVDTWEDGKGIDGAAASALLEQAGIIVNKNTIPFDKRGPQSPSGIRLGTAAVTTLGYKEKDIKKLAAKIAKILK